MPTSSALRQFAEAPDRYTQLSSDVERFADERVCVVQGLTWAAVSDIRVAADDVASLLDETRSLVGAGKSITWWIGPSAEPADLYERLRTLGLGDPPDGARVINAVACATEPPPGPAGVEVHRVDTFDEFMTATALAWDGFGIGEERRAAERPHLRTMFEAAASDGPALFLASLDGKPAGVGRSVYSPRGIFLIGGAVLPWARGRGVYRTLVRARWDDAVARGTPGMVSEAVPDTSYPILKRLGFEDVGAIRRLGDPR